MTKKSLWAFALWLVTATTAWSQNADHLECYKIKDPLKLKGVADLDTAQFGLDPGCKMSKAKFFCAPATKTVISAEEKKVPIVPLDFAAPAAPGDRICYNVKCPKEELPDQEVTDQFGTRTVEKLKAKMVCTPAAKGASQFINNFGTFNWTFPATGQTTGYTADLNDGIPGPIGVSDDGAIEAGATLSYVDNGDGTITDLNTGLMWEKKGDNGGLHDKDNGYRWSGDGALETIWDWIIDVNAEGGTGFAGHNDWRIPNVKELHGIVNYEAANPAISPEFDTGCVASCTVLTCSCTVSSSYWSSSTNADDPFYAWEVIFSNGFVNFGVKSNAYLVRAVRGGS